MEYPIVTGKTFTRGFTLIELLVVMAIIATLLSIAAPRYLRSVDDARDATLKSSLAQMREAIDHYYADRGTYPQTLTDLIDKRYLRSIPIDPITESTQTWNIIALAVPADTKDTATTPNGTDTATESGTIYDIRSGAPGTNRLGEAYANW